MTAKTPVYSTLFHCLYDEQEPVGRLGRGTHYSVFRAVEWLDVCRKRLNRPHIHDFAVIWDEDHDERVIEAIERIYIAGLLSPVQFVGERKGMLTVIIAAKGYWGMAEDAQDYAEQLQVATGGATYQDWWPVQLGMFDRDPGSPHQFEPSGIISDTAQRVEVYLRNIDSLWSLGTRLWGPGDLVRQPSDVAPPLPPMVSHATG
jgi:hypothetical protein